MLSPCGSQINITPDAGPDDSAPGDAYELKWEFDEDSQRYYVSFPDDQWWCLVGVDSGPCRMLGSLLFWHRSRAMSVLDDVMLFMFFDVTWRL